MQCTNGGNGLLGIYPFTYNGSVTPNSWDRLRGVTSESNTIDTGTFSATFNGATRTNNNSRGCKAYIVLGTVSGTSPTLSVQVQESLDSGTTWYNVGPASGNLTATGNTLSLMIYPTNFSQTPGATPANLTTGATQTLMLNMPLGRTWRLVYTIGGTTPSFQISLVNLCYMP
jgi:hypothetical protein